MLYIFQSNAPSLKISFKKSATYFLGHMKNALSKISKSDPVEQDRIETYDFRLKSKSSRKPR
ncbi:hypothetical protein JCM12294_17760 [Desulfocicer niacini]